MKKTILCTAIAAMATISLPSWSGDTVDYGQEAIRYLTELSDPAKGISARPTGTEMETKAGVWIKETLSGFGYDVTAQSFAYTDRNDVKGTSVNYIAEKKGVSDSTIIIVAHYDTKGAEKGSLGPTDNGAGVVTTLAAAQALHAMDSVPHTVRFILVGAEENGLNGSKFYVKDALENGGLKEVIGVVNLDTNAGGDIMYVHSAHSDYDAEFKSACESIGLDKATYNYDTWMRDGFVKASAKALGDDQFVLHPTVAGYPEGETGSWSDHAPFSCAGIAIANIEATNYEINGEHGYDGYSQTESQLMWSTGYNPETKTANDRDAETKWGKIWHTEFDNLEKLEQAFPGRVNKQITGSVDALIEFLSDSTYVK